jgi:hypothetical protein
MEKTSKYLMLQEIAWPREMLVDIVQIFNPKLLKHQTSKRKFIYVKKRANELYDELSKYHDNEISKKSFTHLFKFGLKMRSARQSGTNFFYAGPESLRFIANLLERIPDGGGFHYDGKQVLSPVSSLKVPEILIPLVVNKNKGQDND